MTATRSRANGVIGRFVIAEGGSAMEPEFKFDFEFLSEVPVREIALALWGDGDFNGASDAQMARATHDGFAQIRRELLPS